MFDRETTRWEIDASHFDLLVSKTQDLPPPSGTPDIVATVDKATGLIIGLSIEWPAAPSLGDSPAMPSKAPPNETE